MVKRIESFAFTPICLVTTAISALECRDRDRVRDSGQIDRLRPSHLAPPPGTKRGRDRRFTSRELQLCKATPSAHPLNRIQGACAALQLSVTYMHPAHADAILRLRMAPHGVSSPSYEGDQGTVGKLTTLTIHLCLGRHWPPSSTSSPDTT